MRWLVGMAAVALLGCVPAVRGAELVVNGGFESEPNFGAGFAGDAGFTGFTGTQIPGWTITAGHGVTVHNTALYPTISGSYSVNLDGEGFGGVNADLYQDVASLPGGSYTVSFDHSGWNQSGVNAMVEVTDLTTNAVLYANTFGWTPGIVNETGSFLGTGNALRLHVFELGANGNDNTLMVDNFSITGAVPEPAMIFAVAPVVLAVRRRSR